MQCCVGFCYTAKQFSYISSVQSLSSDCFPPHGLKRARLCCSSPTLSITNWSLLKLLFIESVMPSNHLILCRPLLLPPSIFPSIRVFSNESVLHIRWPEYWSLSFSFSPSNEYSGLIFFRIDWFNLLAVQGTLKSLLQHHSSQASVICFSVIYIFNILFHYGLSQDVESSFLCYTVRPYCLSILHIIVFIC